MTGRTISVEAQWALHGKTLGRDGYRVLRCSDGDLTRRNFDEALSRFTPGALAVLPQVSLSYLTRADERGSYLALAIHEFAERGQYDDDGREIMFTSYFCVPYAELAGNAISYGAMFEAFRAVRLRADDGLPKWVSINVTPPWAPAIDDMAVRVAALLVTGRPVCVLGAEGTSVTDRLRFIDMVMSLLPYGMRSRMSAATWTRSTNRAHRFRLFFTGAARGDAARGDNEQDHVVTWGHPEQISISREHGYAYDYLAWLEDKVREPVARLSELTNELGFVPGHIFQWLELIGIVGPEPYLDYSADGQDLLHPEWTPPRKNESLVETTLRQCAEQIATQGLSRLKSSIAILARYADARGDHADRRRYQEIIAANKLLSPGLPLGKLDAKFYDALLRLAFGMPLSYEGYRQLEDCLGNAPGQPPHPGLLKAIDRGGMADPLVTAIVFAYLGEEKLSNWLRSGDVDAIGLINWLAAERDRPQHARIVCDVTLRYLKAEQGHYDFRAVRSVLSQHGYLARALHLRHFDHDQYQIQALYQFLSAAYPNRLDRPTITHILTGTGSPPTPSLLAAVLMLLARPADARLAWEAYAAGSLELMNLDERTHTRLDKYTPRLDSAPNMPATHRGPQPGTAPRPQPPSSAEYEPWDGTENASPGSTPPWLERALVQKHGLDSGSNAGETRPA